MIVKCTKYQVLSTLRNGQAKYGVEFFSCLDT